MAWANEEITGLLREYAELTQITGGDVFRVRNYEKAARSIRGWGGDIAQLDAKALREIPGVGASIAAKITEYRETGSIAALDELRGKIPPGVLELTRVPGLGPKRALQLNRDLGVESVEDLAAVITAGRLDELAGFGAKSAERIASGIEVYRQGRERVLLDVATGVATTMVAVLSAVPGCQRCVYAGSLRLQGRGLRVDRPLLRGGTLGLAGAGAVRHLAHDRVSVPRGAVRELVGPFLGNAGGAARHHRHHHGHALARSQ